MHVEQDNLSGEATSVADLHVFILINNNYMVNRERETYTAMIYIMKAK